jgi:hypothetical protein
MCRRGFYDLAAVTGKERLLRESRRWVEAIIESQDSDGCFGPRSCKSKIAVRARRIPGWSLI